MGCQATIEIGTICLKFYQCEQADQNNRNSDPSPPPSARTRANVCPNVIQNSLVIL